jgi:glycosyltransferase involved in cell wall biosynthesis
MNILLTHNIREYVDALSLFASEVHVSDNGIRNPVVVSRNNIYAFRVPDGRFLSTIKKISLYLTEHHIDVIYAQGTRDLLVYACARRLSGRRCRLIVTSHSSYAWQSFWKPPLILGLPRLFADAFVFLASCHYSKWKRYCDGIGLPAFSIGNPVDVQRFLPKVNRPRLESWRIGYVGVVNRHKGQSVLLEASHLLHQRGIPFTLHFAGDIKDATYRQELNELIEEYHLEKIVHFYGRLPYDQVPTFLATLDLYVCPSLMEMMPFNVLEAMASGLPVVATSVGGIPDAVRSGIEGFLVPPNNPTVLAEGILKAMDIDLYADRAKSCRRRVETEYSDYVIGSKIKRMCEQIKQLDVTKTR